MVGSQLACLLWDVVRIEMVFFIVVCVEVHDVDDDNGAELVGWVAE